MRFVVIIVTLMIAISWAEARKKLPFINPDFSCGTVAAQGLLELNNQGQMVLQLNPESRRKIELRVNGISGRDAIEYRGTVVKIEGQIRKIHGLRPPAIKVSRIRSGEGHLHSLFDQVTREGCE